MMEVATTETRKKRTLNLACNFCKSRHLKCDGNYPCVQCISRSEECLFITNMKRGRKPKKPQVIPNTPPSPTPTVQNPLSTSIQISTVDSSFHAVYFNKFCDRVLPLFPMFAPKCFISDPTTDASSWDQVQKLNPNTVKNQSLMEIVDCLEYSLLCAHGN
jgi:hypothetical protein